MPGGFGSDRDVLVLLGFTLLLALALLSQGLPRPGAGRPVPLSLPGSSRGLR